jgi:hypothetical protein
MNHGPALILKNKMHFAIQVYTLHGNKHPLLISPTIGFERTFLLVATEVIFTKKPIWF